MGNTATSGSAGSKPPRGVVAGQEQRRADVVGGDHAGTSGIITRAAVAGRRQSGSRRSSRSSRFLPPTTPSDGRQRRQEALRARSFLRREQQAGDLLVGGNEPPLPLSPPPSAPQQQQHLEKLELRQENDDDNSCRDAYDDNAIIIERLQDDIQTLSQKCSALESQNILVAVQQLDWAVAAVSWLLSLLALYGYWHLLSHAVDVVVVPIVVEQRLLQLPILLPLLTRLRRLEWLPPALLRFFFKVAMLAVPYCYNARTHGSFHRRFQVFAVAFIVLGRVRMCRWRERLFLQPDRRDDGDRVPAFGEACTNDGIWEANYEISARFLFLSVFRLRGLWTKSAQYLASRADFMPVAYIRELSKLQDAAPPTEWKDVEHWLPPALRRDLIELDTTPLASASIGQVHVATVRRKSTTGRRAGSGGTNGADNTDDDTDGETLQKVVIKVQHPHARTLMLDDFWSLIVICRIVGWLEPDYAFMEILMREWAVEARKELDFTNELYHLEEARTALEQMFPTDSSVVYTSPDRNGNRVPFRAEVPAALSEYSNRNVLVMEYCEGCRVDSFAQLSKWKLDRLQVMDGLAQTFAHFMYCSTIFNGDPHPGNLFCRPGLTKTVDGSHPDGSFTLVLLDWGLAKQLPDPKRLAFCQMVYAASTLDYGLLLDSYKTLGLRMKREDAGQSMEDMRFFLRDMAPRSEARRRIRSKMEQGKDLAKKNKEKVPMESKAYPGELFFFIRVNELLHGLGSKFQVDLKYLDTLRPYAERGLRSLQASLPPSLMLKTAAAPVPIGSPALQEKLENTLKDLKAEGQFVGGQICILNSKGDVQVDVVAGSLGGLRDDIPMQRDALILGYSCTKAVTATLAHMMVQEGYLKLDEPVCSRVWTSFCGADDPPHGLARALGISQSELQKRWKWKRQVTLRHILNHSAGFWSALPPNMTVKDMASCETCCRAFEYNPQRPGETLLPTRPPGERSEYHFMSYGWLVAGTVRGAYAVRHGGGGGRPEVMTYSDVYESVLRPRLGRALQVDLGFRPMGGGRADFVLANTVTSDVTASRAMQEQRERGMGGTTTTTTSSSSSSSSGSQPQQDGKQPAGADQAAAAAALELMKTFRGSEFLLDPRIWNSRDALDANVPAAGGRFSAAALARFYHELGNCKAFVAEHVLEEVSAALPATFSVDDDVVDASSSVPGVVQPGLSARIANDGANGRTRLSLGYQLIQTDRDAACAAEDDGGGGKKNSSYYSGIGHAGVGGSIGFWHRPTGLSVGVMLNKADGGEGVTLRILRVISEHYSI